MGAWFSVRADGNFKIVNLSIFCGRKYRTESKWKLLRIVSKFGYCFNFAEYFLFTTLPGTVWTLSEHAWRLNKTLFVPKTIHNHTPLLFNYGMEYLLLGESVIYSIRQYYPWIVVCFFIFRLKLTTKFDIIYKTSINLRCNYNTQTVISAFVFAFSPAVGIGERLLQKRQIMQICFGVKISCAQSLTFQRMMGSARRIFVLMEF